MDPVPGPSTARHAHQDGAARPRVPHHEPQLPGGAVRAAAVPAAQVQLGAGPAAAGAAGLRVAAVVELRVPGVWLLVPRPGPGLGVALLLAVPVPGPLPAPDPRALLPGALPVPRAAAALLPAALLAFLRLVLGCGAELLASQELLRQGVPGRW